MVVIYDLRRNTFISSEVILVLAKFEVNHFFCNVKYEYLLIDILTIVSFSL